MWALEEIVSENYQLTFELQYKLGTDSGKRGWRRKKRPRRKMRDALILRTLPTVLDDRLPNGTSDCIK